MAAKLTTDNEKFSYALGMNIAASVMHLPLDIDYDIVLSTLSDLLKGGQPELDPEEYQNVMQKFQQELQEKTNAAKKAAGDANSAKSKEFLAANARKDGIKVTKSGLQYEVLTEGTGTMPKADSMVKVHYEGKLIDGRIFDSSIQRGTPAEFRLNQVIAGWTEGLQLMKAGSKYRFYIPSELAYGERGAGEVIPPNAALIFDVELIEVK